MHAVGHNDHENEMGGQNDDACGKIAKIQTAPPMTRARKYSTLNEESFGRPIFGLLSEPQPRGSVQALPSPRTERVPDQEGDADPWVGSSSFSSLRDALGS